MAPLIWASGLIALTVLFVWLRVRAVRWAKRGTRGGAMLAAADFPFPEQPPPNEIMQRANRIRKSVEPNLPH